MEYVNTIVSEAGMKDVVTGTQTVSLRAVLIQLDVVLMIRRFISIAVAEVRVQDTVPDPVIEGLRVVVGIVVVVGSSHVVESVQPIPPPLCMFQISDDVELLGLHWPQLGPGADCASVKDNKAATFKRNFGMLGNQSKYTLYARES